MIEKTKKIIISILEHCPPSTNKLSCKETTVNITRVENDIIVHIVSRKVMISDDNPIDLIIKASKTSAGYCICQIQGSYIGSVSSTESTVRNLLGILIGIKEKEDLSGTAN